MLTRRRTQRCRCKHLVSLSETLEILFSQILAVIYDAGASMLYVSVPEEIESEVCRRGN